MNDEVTLKEEPGELERAQSDLEVAQNELQLSQAENTELKAKLEDANKTLGLRAQVLKDMNEKLIEEQNRAEKAEDALAEASGLKHSFLGIGWSDLSFEAACDFIGRLFPGRHVISNPTEQKATTSVIVDGVPLTLVLDHAKGTLEATQIHGAQSTHSVPTPGHLIVLACEVH